MVAAGLPSGFHFHDLRHTGKHLAATAGARTRELMHRKGHGSMWAVLIYQHATTERGRAIAQRLNDLVRRDDDGQLHVSCTERRRRPSRDREQAPFPPVEPLERATGIEPA
ncbi:phage integrase family protein [Actinoalloteichus sp. GBA129-24]|uniref:Phage integrase family protein n=1 Tax=Actinoalloteichus fjordicus TaxID=1612552 RepID=A0AAC9L9H8_9PSEU|nr:phage integrase family protein [Actinoalloteichus fjordicus]APU19624.1 phage integrase family protein [Actinoalloteichus sp. GBA129-24]